MPSYPFREESRNRRIYRSFRQSSAPSLPTIPVRCLTSLTTEAEAAILDGVGQDVVAGLLGSARNALERLLGIACDDALLDSVFSRFCVGK